MGRVARTAALSAALVLAVVTLGACSGSSSGGTTAGTSSTPSLTPSGTPTPDAEALATLAAKAAATDFAGTYVLDTVDPKRPDGITRVYKKGALYRIDVDLNGTSSRLITTTAGAVSCQITPKKWSCLLVARPGSSLPRLFDPGLERIFTTTLKAVSSSSSAVTVTRNGILPASGDLPAAECFQVSGSGVDTGEYCLTADGLVRRAQFPTGTITLKTYTFAVPPTSFVPPTRATPLPGLR